MISAARRSDSPRHFLWGIVVLAILSGTIFFCWPVVSEAVSDNVAYSLIRPGWSRRDVEKALPGWNPNRFYSDALNGSPGRVRYQLFGGIYVDVYYDSSDHVVRTYCNG